MAIPGIEPPTWAEKSVEERYERELAILRARLAAAEKVVEAARRSHNGLGGVLRHTFADERQAMVQGIYLDLDEALTAYQEHSDGR